MKKNIPAMFPETYYHIYNRGINKTNIFFEDSNYSFFLEKFASYISPIADTYAYCLLKNHFHFLIRFKSEEEIRSFINTNADRVLNPVSVGISRQFSHFFNSYSQSINRKYDRTGGLFETPFRRIPVEDDQYFTKLISYIHLNPQKHGLIDDYREYPYSSYQGHIAQKATKLKREEVLHWFGGKEAYVRFHEEVDNISISEKILIELD